MDTIESVASRSRLPLLRPGQDQANSGKNAGKKYQTEERSATRAKERSVTGSPPLKSNPSKIWD